VFFKFVILCTLQSPFLNLCLCLSFSSHTFLMGYSEKNFMARDRTPIPFINQRPSSWFLFYLYLCFILLSLPITITNKSLYFIKSQLDHHNISNESLIGINSSINSNISFLKYCFNLYCNYISSVINYCRGSSH